MPTFRRQPVKETVQQTSKTATFMAPLRGWVDSENLATHKPNGASVLENFFPTTRGIKPRGGSQRHATITDGVKSLFCWKSAATEKMFGADADSIYNVTAPADASVEPTAAVTGQTSGFYSTTMFSNVSGDYLIVVNGTDPHQNYNGTAWATTPAITGVTSSTLSYVWVFKNRLFFIQKNTLRAWCLAVDAIGGAAIEISLSGVFKKGGSLMFGDTWSLDAGDGQDDVCVFMTTAGECAIYSGSDPSSVTSWALVSTYDIGIPLGPHAKFRAGGDLVIATRDGLIPLSAALQKDKAALGLTALTRPIEVTWHNETASRTATTWSCLKWIGRNMVIVGMPAVTGLPNQAFVVNIYTGAWAKYTGWDVACQAEMNNFAYFGTTGGRVMLAEASGKDDGVQYLCTCVGLYDNLKSPATSKTATMARSTWTYNKPFTPKLSFSFDYIATLPTYPAAATHPSLDLWDVGLWDVAKWDSAGASQMVTRWVSVYGEGFAVAPNIQMTCSHASPPEAEMVSVDLLYEEGGVGV